MEDAFICEHLSCSQAGAAWLCILAAAGTAAKQAGFNVGVVVLHSGHSILGIAPWRTSRKYTTSTGLSVPSDKSFFPVPIRSRIT